VKRILIVDNEVDFCFFVKKNLEAVGDFEVSICSESAKALSQAEALHPDLVLLDLLMPELSGLEVESLLRARRKTRDIPIVFLTVAASPEEGREERSIEGRPVLSKPVEIRELIEVIHSKAA
jgi:CheY-like chemotaxis protein